MWVHVPCWANGGAWNGGRCLEAQDPSGFRGPGGEVQARTSPYKPLLQALTGCLVLPLKSGLGPRKLRGISQVGLHENMERSRATQLLSESLI